MVTDEHTPGVYYCPACKQPFDVTNRLADLEIADHEKLHEAETPRPSIPNAVRDGLRRWLHRPVR